MTRKPMVDEDGTWLVPLKNNLDVDSPIWEFVIAEPEHPEAWSLYREAGDMVLERKPKFGNFRMWLHWNEAIEAYDLLAMREEQDTLGDSRGLLFVDVNAVLAEAQRLHTKRVELIQAFGALKK